MCTADGRSFGSVAEALQMADATMDYLNSPAAELDGAACGQALTALGEIQAKFTAAHARFLARFDAADAHDADGYATSAAWLAALARMSKRDASAAVRQMRTLGRHRPLADALAAGEVTASWAAEILRWIRELPAALRADAGRVAGLVGILVTAAASGASLDDLATLLGRAKALWQAEHPDPDDGSFEDRYVQVATTFGGAGAIRGDLTPECAAVVQAVLDALGKKAGPEDARTRGQRFHDALQHGCQLLIRAKMVPDRAGADTHVAVHVPLAALRGEPGASVIEDAWLRGEPGYLTGKDAEVAGCDAVTYPVVTGHADLTIIDKIIALALAATDDPYGQDKPRPHPGPSPQAAQALRYAIGRLAIDFVSGPGGIAAALRTGLLQPPFNTPSLPLDIGHSATIPASIRRAVTLRDKHCAWPGCDVLAAGCDVHHLQHQKDGGPTSVTSCGLYCQFHHDVCIHRWGWQVTRHPDGTTEARSPDGRTILRSHGPPTLRAG